jgi:MFS family permease
MVARDVARTYLPPITARMPGLGLFGIRDFRLLWMVTGLSFTGIQMRMMALSWLVLEITDSTMWVGVVNGIAAVPVILLSLYAGALSDRVDRRLLIARATGAIAVMALIVGILADTGGIALWHIIAMSLLSSAAVALFQPATQTLLFDVVGPDRLFRAVSLNASVMNLGQMTGPAAAGILIAAFGIGSSFYLVAVMYLVAMVGVLAIRSGRDIPVKAASPILQDAAEALAYVRRTPHVAWLLLLSTSTLFAGVYFPFVAVYARDVFNGGAREFGFLMGAQGAGFLVGSLTMITIGNRLHKGKMLITAATFWSTGMIVFAFSTNFPLTLVTLFGMGFIAMFWVNTLRTIMQTAVPDEMRGRVMGLYMMTIQAISLGWLVGGSLATVFGNEVALVTGASAFIGIVVLAFARSPELRRLA